MSKTSLSESVAPTSPSNASVAQESGSGFARVAAPATAADVALLTGGIDKPYVFGLAMELVSKGARLEVIGSDELDCTEMHSTPGLRFLNLRGEQGEDASLGSKVSRILVYYLRLLRYAAAAKPKVFHILWNNKFLFFDRTLLMLYYKLLGKKITFTAHNVNAARRDSTDSALNRLTLKIQYRLADHIFVHTEKMREELMTEFGVPAQGVSVIPFGINNAVPNTDVTPEEAKRHLGIKLSDKTILFFGRISQYKGLEFLASAFRQLVAKDPNYRLVIAGKSGRDSDGYLETVRQTIQHEIAAGRVIQKIEFIPDKDTELYFKAADVLALPYTQVYQSGVLFLGYSFGLPVVATDVGAVCDDVVVGRTGYLCRPENAQSLAAAIETYFDSELYRALNRQRQEIQDYANASHSWDAVGQMTTRVYASLLGGRQETSEYLDSDLQPGA
jgi:glycosyltransferase involved in cell wall biosynthesis